MKILLYFEGQKLIAGSGIGNAMHHQMAALRANKIAYTLDPNDEYDILHINTYGLNSRKIIKQARKAHKPVIYHAHSTQEDFKNSFIGSNQLAPLYGKYLKSLYQLADVLITPTPYAKKLLTNYGLKMPIYPISNGIDINKYQINETKITAFRNYFKLDVHKKVVISVGLFFERKGIDDFVKLAELNPEITFIWFGHINFATIPRKIRKLVKTNHPANVIFPGYITGDIIQGAYSGADAFLFPSREETEGIVVLEALAASQNVIIRDIPVYADWLTNHENVFKAHNIAEFNQQLHYVLEHDTKLIKNAGVKVAQARSITTVGEQLKAVYQSLLTK
ncbi:glycosyltransferase [Periweissella beninensis]|uniref:glycosyltransferase n=1 Tax=Periweissella beninensis TaxID=504936 RepID=UPI0021A4B10A|nr:glycosyltransferase [Periweissella beninensis]MCT4395581.1 glycosyltransferase [Periweissella beninensis]